MDVLKFSQNWNKKLDCLAFTTLRISDRFVVGQYYDIIQGGVNKGRAEVMALKRFRLDQINEYIAYIDTGHNKKECQAILVTMYKESPIDWKTQLITFVLMRYVK